MTMIPKEVIRELIKDSVVQLTDSTGKTADQYAFDEFGNAVAGGKQSPNAANVLHSNFGYAGEQWDSEAGLQYLRKGIMILRWVGLSIGIASWGIWGTH